MCPRSAGAVPGSSPAGGGCRTRRERATEPMTAAPAGTNDPIPTTVDFIRRLPPTEQPSLDAHLPIGATRRGLESRSRAAAVLFGRRCRESLGGNRLCGGAARFVAGHLLEAAAPGQSVELHPRRRPC